MIPIKYYDKGNPVFQQEEVAAYCEELLEKRDKVSTLDDWCEAHLPTDNGKKYTFRDVVKATPEKLILLKQHLDSLGDTALETINDELYNHDKNGKRKTSYIINTLYGKIREKAKNRLTKLLNVRVCPYCNRNYVYSYNGVHTCQLDHFFSKTKYPILAVSFYNLIPVCGGCNNKKSDQDFLFNPHLKEEEIFRFSYSVNNADFYKNENSVEVEIYDDEGLYQEQMDVLKLKDIYQGHRDIITDLARKHLIFSDAYIKALADEFKNFVSEAEVKELIYGVPLSVENAGNRPLSKFTRDILKEMEAKTELIEAE